MKKIITLSIAIIFGLNTYSQCTPNTLYENESYGFWPSTVEGLPDAEPSVDYSVTITIMSATNGGEIDPAYSAFDIDSTKVSGVTGLPAGIDFVCANDDCIMLGGELSCLKFEGNTSVIGTHDIVIGLIVYGSNAVLGNVAVPVDYPGYSITVANPDGISELSSESISLSQNSPNPFSSETLISYGLKKSEVVTFNIYNMIGEIVYSEKILSDSGVNEMSFKNNTLDDGIYMYSITANGYTQTKRMVVRK